MATDTDSRLRGASFRRRVVLPSIILGAGIAGTLDEIVLHQLLRWHHFYSGSTRAVGLITDGVFHLVSSAALLAGVVMLWRNRAELMPNCGRGICGGVLAGLGGFNLYDSGVQHKLLGLHQVREGVASTLPYDLAFTGAALLALLAGLLLSAVRA